jgi:hypothetical protein
MGTKIVPIVSVLLLSYYSSVVASPGKYKVVEVKDGANITGRITFEGQAPNTSFTVTKDPAVCCAKGEKAKPSPRLVVGENRGVQNTVVFLTEVPRGKPFQELNPVLDQKHCTYEPHILLIPQRSKLKLRNSDEVLHNAHAFLRNTDVFNLAMPTKGQVIEKRMRRPGIISVKCDAGHTWMSSYIFVIKHPYYSVTDKEGRFSLDNVPAGKKYTLRVWHEGWRILEKKGENYSFSKAVQLDVPLAVKVGAKMNLNFALDAEGTLIQMEA